VVAVVAVVAEVEAEVDVVVMRLAVEDDAWLLDDVPANFSA
jgi:hypothetical protein